MFTTEIDRHVLPEEESKINLYGNATVEAGLLDPDLQLVFEEPGSNVSARPTFAVEVAFSQDGDDLEE